MRCGFSLALLSTLPSIAVGIGVDWSDPTSPVADVENVVVSVGPDGGWLLVTTVGDRIWLSRGDGVSWEPAEPVSPPGVAASGARVAGGGEVAWVVWADDRVGHPEVWARPLTTAGLGPEHAPSLDDVASDLPRVAGDPADRVGLTVAWRDGGDGGEVHVRRRVEDAWLDVEVVGADEPGPIDGISVAARDDWAAVQWTAHTTPPVIRETSRRLGLDEAVPSTWTSPRTLVTGHGSVMVALRRSMYDEEGGVRYAFAYEAEVDGVTEVHGGVEQDGPDDRFPLSPPDGIPSVMPSLSALPVVETACAFTYQRHDLFAGWVDLDGADPQAYTTRVRVQNWVLARGFGIEPVGGATVGGPGMATRAGVPTASLAQAWTEGVPPTLQVRTGTAVACSVFVTDGDPDVLTVSPGTDLAITVRDLCSGDGLPDTELFLSISGFDGLVFDPPLMGVVGATTDPGGAARFDLRMGGCSDDGEARVFCSYETDWEVAWSGVRSPDLDASCTVTDADVALVEARLGSDDWCADLDGSGLVDAADVALVQASLGAACRSVSVSGTGPDGTGPGLRVGSRPGPVVELLLGTGHAVRSLEVLDVAGRRVRSIAVAVGHDRVVWDGRDDGGVAVASGRYFVRAPEAGATVGVAIVR